MDFFRSLRVTTSTKHLSVPTPKAIKAPQGSVTDVTCFNCMGPGHFSNDCSLPQVSFKQKQANRAKVEQMQNQNMPQQAQAAALQFFQQSVAPDQSEHQHHPKAEGPLQEISGNAGRAHIKLPMTPAILQRGQSLSSMLPLKPPVPANAATKGAAFKDRKLKQPAVNKDFRVVKPAQKAEASKAAQKTAEQGVERTIVANHQQPTVQPMEEVEHTGPSGRPPGYRTPSPPHNAVEPISPVQADPRPYQPQKQRQNQLPTQIPDHTPYQRQQPHREQ